MRRIIVNGIPLLSPRSGVGNYVYYNFKSMLSESSDWSYDFYYGLQWSPLLKERFPEPYFNLRKKIKRVHGSYSAYRICLDYLFKTGQCFKAHDLYHETNFVPMPFKGKTVLTIFDLSFFLYPQTHPSDRIRYMEKYFYKRVNWVSHFITISEQTKEEMVKHIGISREKITVTPLGVDQSYRPILPDITKTKLSEYGLNAGSYILYVGTLEPRKNIKTLLQAYAKLSVTVKSIYPLVLVGGLGWLMDDLKSEIEKLDLGSSIKLTDYVPKSDLPSLYSGATVFVYPSLYEGFGLPILEAMACGVPVITSRVSSLAEVAGEAGVLIQPEDVESLKENLEELITTPYRRHVLSQRGLEQAKKFTWEKCAAKTLEVYEKVILEG